MDLLREKLMFW